MTTPREPREPLDVQPIAERAAQATPGPWLNEFWLRIPCNECEGWYHEGGFTDADGFLRERLITLRDAKEPAKVQWSIGRLGFDGGAVDHANAEFIAHAREDIPALLAEVQRLAADNARLRGLIAQAEWNGFAQDFPVCPWCNGSEYDKPKHASDCPAFRAPGEPR